MAVTYSGPELAAVLVYLMKCTTSGLDEHTDFDKQLETYAQGAQTEGLGKLKDAVEQMKQFKNADKTNAFQLMSAHFAIAALLTALSQFKPKNEQGITIAPLWGECRPVSYADVITIAKLP